MNPESARPWTLSGKTLLAIMLGLGVIAVIIFFINSRILAGDHEHLRTEAPRIAKQLNEWEKTPGSADEIRKERLKVEELLRILPADGSLWLLHARASWLLDEMDQTVIASTYSIDQGPDTSAAHWLRARAFARLKDREKAIADIEIAIKMGLPEQEEAERLLSSLKN